MQLIFSTLLRLQLYPVFIKSWITLKFESVLEIMAGETGWPVESLAISHGGRRLDNVKATLEETGMTEHDLLILGRKGSPAIPPSLSVDDDPIEKIRLHLLNDPSLRARTQQVFSC